MNSKEIDILHNILINKANKFKFINSQNYAKAAEARDEERYWEKQLIKEINKDDVEPNQNFIMNMVNDYFKENLAMEYLKNGDDIWSKNILREIKIKYLGL